MINHRFHLTTLIPSNLWGAEERTHCLQRVGGIIALSLILSVFHIHVWVGWVGEIKYGLIAAASYAFAC